MEQQIKSDRTIVRNLLKGRPVAVKATKGVLIVGAYQLPDVMGAQDQLLKAGVKVGQVANDTNPAHIPHWFRVEQTGTLANPTVTLKETAKEGKGTITRIGTPISEQTKMDRRATRRVVEGLMGVGVFIRKGEVRVEGTDFRAMAEAHGRFSLNQTPVGNLQQIPSLKGTGPTTYWFKVNEGAAKVIGVAA